MTIQNTSSDVTDYEVSYTALANGWTAGSARTADEGAVVTIILDMSDLDRSEVEASTSTELADAIAAGKETIYLEDGTYTLDPTAIDSDLTLIGSGNTTIRTNNSGSGSDAWAIKVDDGVNLVVQNITFEGQGGIAIKQVGSNYTFEISDCTFNEYDTSIQLFNNNGGSITDCDFDSDMVDISLSNCAAEVVISGNSYSNNVDYENIGIAGDEETRANVTIEDAGAKVQYYESDGSTPVNNT